MKPLIILGMLALPLAPVDAAAQAQMPGQHPVDQSIALQSTEARDPTGAGSVQPMGAMGAGPHPAAEVDWAAQLYHTRPLVIFADSPENPDFVRQLQLIERDLATLEERRVVVVLDTDPAAMSEWRKRLRPNGFSLVLLDTDLRPVIRKPSPWDVREISRTIDRLPSRRQDVSRQFPSGR